MKPVWNSHLSEPKEKTDAILEYTMNKGPITRLKDKLSEPLFFLKTHEPAQTARQVLFYHQKAH